MTTSFLAILLGGTTLLGLLSLVLTANRKVAVKARINRRPDTNR